MFLHAILQSAQTAASSPAAINKSEGNIAKWKTAFCGRFGGSFRARVADLQQQLGNERRTIRCRGHTLRRRDPLGSTAAFSAPSGTALSIADPMP
jgi:hypothetical protein